MNPSRPPTQISLPAELADALELVAAERHTRLTEEALTAIEAHIRSAHIKAEVRLLTDDELEARLANSTRSPIATRTTRTTTMPDLAALPRSSIVA